MKRKLILILLSFIGVTFLNAQVPVSMSVKPGINISKVVFTEADYEDGDYLGHLYTGVNLEFINDKHLSILAETGLTVKTYDYLYFSPLFKVRWELKNFIPSIFLGPRMDIMVTRDAIREGSLSNPNQFVFGSVSGFDLEYRFFPFGFLIGMHYQYDFTDAYESNSYAWKHSTFAVYFGMKAYFGASPEKNRRGYNYKMF